ncbi:MAG: YidC/Oxa1 family membrane protein insertase [Anaerosomatales bacterium]|nr:YidC/Oxa1 family membrane protein insertase [Anaerosomatales bacterium]MDT8433723.1 YidC/Oxa1 family membrane protein insertase [Anaerosomatales bacterium]
MWLAIKEAIFSGLQFLHDVTGDYGVAIILLTVAIRLLMIPLTVKQTRSMYEMQRIQPKIKELQKKYKNDKEKLQEETLKFYQENKVNPFGGCLPLLLQMPVFIALYQVLGGTPDRPGLFLEYVASLPEAQQAAATRFWIILPDLTATPASIWSAEGLLSAIPYALLVVLFGLSIWLPQMLMPGEGQQKQVAMIMAVFMLYIGWISPAGVLLYWVTSSVLGIAQQQIQLKLLGHGEDA